MKVHELLSLLTNLDPELEVTMSGYEGGFNCVSGITPVREFLQGYYEPWYYGPNELLEFAVEYGELTPEQVAQKGTFKAVTLY